MKTREIDGVYFEVKKARECKLPYTLTSIHYRGRTLADCYAKPSIYKVDIYEYWRNFVSQSDCFECITIGSYNCFAFTLYMIYINPETQEILGYAHITKEHNYLYLF